MSDIEDLVARFLELREDAPELDPAEFASRYPDCAVELRSALEHLIDTISCFAPLEEVGGKHAQGTQLGKYTLQRELGRGGMGVVYEATRADEPDGERVAIKLLPFAGLLGERALERFRREVRTLERLDHEQIVRVREFELSTDSPYLVMDLIEGESLSLRDAPTPVGEAVELIASLARAVHAAHEAGVLHRDLKPQNVIVTATGVPVLLDFGLVHARDEATLTSSGDLLGTPRYMAPEQARGEAATVRSDVYSLGLLLYELLLGKPAFAQADRSAVLHAVARGEVGAWSSARAHWPRSLATILSCALAWKPARRYSSAEALADDLERCARGEPVHARAPGIWAISSDYLARRRVGSVITLLSLVLAVTLLFTWLLPRLEAEREDRRRQVQGHFDRALTLHLQDRDEACAAELERLLALDPGHAEGRLLASLSSRTLVGADLQRTRGRLIEGLEAERNGDVTQAEAAFREVLEQHPESPWPTVLLAGLLWRDGRMDLAQAEFVAGTQRMPNSLVLAHELADLLYERQDYEWAAREYERSLVLEKGMPELWQGLALARLRLNEDDAALDANRRAMDLSATLEPDHANLMAALLDRRGHHEEAQEVFRRLVEENPEETTFLFNLAYSLDTQSRIAEAKPLYEQVLDLQPDHVQATVCLAWLHASSQEEALRDPDLATEMILEALVHDRGATPELVMGAEQVARETGIVEPVIELLGELALEGEVDERSVRLSRAKRALEQLRKEED